MQKSSSSTLDKELNIVIYAIAKFSMPHNKGVTDF